MQIDASQIVTGDTRAAQRLANAKERARIQLRDWINATTLAISDDVPSDERLSWTAKEIAARAVLASTATPSETALLADEGALSGEALLPLATKVIQKADAYRATIAKLSGWRRHTKSLIDTSVTPEAVQTVLNGAFQAASTMLSQET